MILVDGSSGSKELLNYRPLNDRLIATKTSLSSGDVAFLCNSAEGTVTCGIEVKNPADLLAGIKDGRFMSQMRKMTDFYSICYLLIYGQYKCGNNDTFLHRKSEDGFWIEESVKFLYVQSMLLDIEDAGIPVVNVTDIQQAAIWIAVCARQWSKAWNQRGERFASFYIPSRNALKNRLKPKTHQDRIYLRKLELLSCIPGIGIEKAPALLSHFGDLNKIFTATAEDLAECPGIGKSLSKSLHDFLRR